MIRFFFYFACAVLLQCTIGQVNAAPIDDDTKCEAVNEIMGISTPRSRRALEVVNHIKKTMQALDRSHGLDGKHQIFPRMTKKGQVALARFAASRCSDRPELPLTDTVVETYEAVRATHARLELKKARRKQAKALAPHAPAVLHEPRGSSPALARLFGDL